MYAWVSATIYLNLFAFGAIESGKDVIKLPNDSIIASCHSDSNILEPYVPDPGTAKAIFLAIEAARVPGADKINFPLVDVLDRGRRWVVLRHSATIIGGGQLEIEISKCTGRIYRATFSK